MNYDINTTQGMVQAIQWTKNLLATLNDGGVWIVPRSGTMVRVDKKTQTATLTGVLPDPSITRVLTAMGWKVVQK